MSVPIEKVTPGWWVAEYTNAPTGHFIVRVEHYADGNEIEFIGTERTCRPAGGGIRFLLMLDLEALARPAAVDHGGEIHEISVEQQARAMDAARQRAEENEHDE